MFTSRLNGLGLISDCVRFKPGSLEGSARVENCRHAFPFTIRWSYRRAAGGWALAVLPASADVREARILRPQI